MKRYLQLSLLVLSFLIFSCEQDESDLAVPDADSVTESDESEGAASQSQFDGVLTAAEWNDLLNWPFWTDLMNDQTYGSFQWSWKLYPNIRYSIRVLDQNNIPVVGAVVKLIDQQSDIWIAKTDNMGKAELWDNFFAQGVGNSPIIQVDYLQNRVELVDIHTVENGTMDCILPVATTKPNNVDLMFVVDATGSMGDEIEFLKSDLLNVIEKIQQTDSQLEIQLSTVFYRDVSDVYLTRSFDFSTDYAEMARNVDEQSAGGGGDIPEAVEKALETALQQSWSATARAKLMFLILDAPPHDTAEQIASLQQSVREMSEKGIKLIPICASGIDKNTEFLMRFMAIATSGTYVFLTDDSGVGGEHLLPTVGEYQVEKLNDLIVRLITKYSN